MAGIAIAIAETITAVAVTVVTVAIVIVAVAVTDTVTATIAPAVVVTEAPTEAVAPAIAMTVGTGVRIGRLAEVGKDLYRICRHYEGIGTVFVFPEVNIGVLNVLDGTVLQRGRVEDNNFIKVVALICRYFDGDNVAFASGTFGILGNEFNRTAFGNYSADEVCRIGLLDFLEIIIDEDVGSRHREGVPTGRLIVGRNDIMEYTVIIRVADERIRQFKDVFVHKEVDVVSLIISLRRISIEGNLRSFRYIILAILVRNQLNNREFSV